MKQAFNPYLPSYEYVPDGEPYLFGDRVYVYGSHDAFQGKEFCVNNYVCWSAPVNNLGEWNYEGVIYDRLQDPLNVRGDQFLYAPDVTQGADGKYYLYYELHKDKGVSVAVADTPTGPYEYLGQVKHPDGTPYGSKKGDAHAFDPSIFIDEDGRVYLYTGLSPAKGGFRLYWKLRGGCMDGGYVIELEPDMLTIKGKQYETIPGVVKAVGTEYEGHGFLEASSMRKINGIYYLVYSSILSHELCYAVSDSPIGPFAYGGTIVSIGDIGFDGVTADKARNFTGNTHGGIICIQNQWYIFYHRQTNQQQCARQGCAEPIFIDEAGHIAQVEVTSCGLNGGPLAGIGTYEARIACNLWGKKGTFAYVNPRHKEKGYPYFTQSGRDREDNPDQYIANMQDKATAGFKYFDFVANKPSYIAVELRGNANGVFKVTADEKGQSLLATVPVVVSDKKEWTCIEVPFASPNEVCALYFTYEGEGYVDFNSYTLKAITDSPTEI